MPRLVRAPRRVTEDCAALTMPKAVPQSSSSLAAQSLACLWRRLLHGYVHFTQPGCDPFVTDAPTALGVDADGDVALDALWTAGFAAGTSASEALIVHLFLANEHFDAVSWIIAFCLIDRLQLNHYVHQRLRNLSFWQPAGNDAYGRLRLPRVRHTQLLFTAYSLAFKWHLDYSVSVKYLTNLLPHTHHARAHILHHTIKQEVLLLGTLEFNCAVSETHVLQLLDHFLTASERSYVLQVVHPG
ncbi:hypothetical protein NESM_000072700 [Novymonas esmeraldas]|uniref:Uncharacterized protein n=1 Tax=Novymonas esmeraldas TaxID=1808958 RepID=A0AAW0F1H6_9TRYP